MCGGKCECADATKHVFTIRLSCTECEETDTITGTIESILSGIGHAGWPICAECGKEMDFSVKK